MIPRLYLLLEHTAAIILLTCAIGDAILMGRRDGALFPMLAIALVGFFAAVLS